MKKLLLCACIGVMAAGCGTIVDSGNIQCRSGSAEGPRVYGGVRTNIEQMKVPDNKNWISEPILVLDTPLSAVLDTITLVFSIPKACNK